MVNCIFCYKDFSEPVPEHVIPKSINGQYTIHNVCKKCNHLLNKNIDEPFTKHQIIGTYKFAFKIKGRSRSVTNPVKNKKIKLDGREYSATLTDELKIDASIPPEFPKIKDLKPNSNFTVKLDSKDLNRLENYLTQVSERLGVPRENITILDKKIEYRPERTLQIMDSNNTLILGFSKIMYETACDLIGEDYVNDPIAQKYAKMLVEGRIEKDLISELNPEGDIINQVFMQTASNLDSLKNNHMIIISGYKGIGLIGVIKIFDLLHVQILSRNSNFWKYGLTTVLNNFKKNELGIFKPNKLPRLTLSIYNDGITDFSGLEKEFESFNNGKKCALYSSEDELYTSNAFELVDDFNFERTIDSNYISYLNLKIFVNSRLHIKSSSNNLRLGVETIEYHFEIETLKKKS